MKLAFISDIHANLPALLAVLDDLNQEQPDAIYCLGDLVNFAGWDNEVIQLLRKRKITCIQGNHDEGIGQNKSIFSFSFKGNAQKEFGDLSIKLVNKTISSENRKFLAELPFKIELEFRLPFQTIKLAMVHGSVTSNEEYVQKETDDEYFLEMLESIEADILLMGHTHIPYHKAIFCEEENHKIYRHAINVGSVGKSKNGNPAPCYCTVEIDSDADLRVPESIKVHHKQIPYNTKEVIDKIREIGLPDAYDEYLKGR